MWPRIGHFGRCAGGRARPRVTSAARSTPVRESLLLTFGQVGSQPGVRGRPTAATKITLTQLRLLAFAGYGAETGNVVHWNYAAATGDAAGGISLPHMPVDMAALGLQVRTLRDAPSVPDGVCRRVGTLP